MNSREVVVRIIQAQEKAQPPKRAPEAPAAEKKEKNLFHLILNGLVLSAIGLLAVYLGVSYFHLGISLKEIMVMVGIPMTLGIITSYAIF